MKTITSVFIVIGIFLIAYVIYNKKQEHPETFCCTLNDSSKREFNLEEDAKEIELFEKSSFSLDIDDTLSYQPYYINVEKKKSFTLFARVSETIGEGRNKKVKSLQFALLNSKCSYSTIHSIAQPTDNNGNPSIAIEFKHGKQDTPFIPKIYEYTIDKEENYIKRGDLIEHPHSQNSLPIRNGIQAVPLTFTVGGHVCTVRAN